MAYILETKFSKEFLLWKFLYFESNFTKIALNNSFDNKSSLVQTLAWRQAINWINWTSSLMHIWVIRPKCFSCYTAFKVFNPKCRLYWNELIFCIMKLQVLCGIMPKIQEFVLSITTEWSRWCLKPYFLITRNRVTGPWWGESTDMI